MYFLFRLLNFKYICANSSGLLRAEAAILCVHVCVSACLPMHACFHTSAYSVKRW